jgi:hypothetical protein
MESITVDRVLNKAFTEEQGTNAGVDYSSDVVEGSTVHMRELELYIEKKEEFIEQLHGVSWHYSQSSGSSQLHRQKHTKCNKNRT